MKTLIILLAFIGQNALADTLPLTYNRIHLQAKAEAEVENDLKVAELYSKHQAKSSIEVANKVNQDIKWAVSIAKQFGVEVRTLGYSTNPLYERTKNNYNPNKIIGWSATQSIQLKTRDAELLGDVIGKIQQRLKMSALRYEVSKARQSAVKEKLVDEAIANFVKRAQKITQGFGMNSYRLVKINVNSGANTIRPPIYRGKMAMMAADAVEAATVEAGTSDINVNINGEIELN